MAQPIYQCSYTNITHSEGGTVTSGWQAAAVSPNIPGRAYDTCTRLQSANSAFCSNAVDEWGNALELYEIYGDGSYLYVLRTQYGLNDRLGRPNMFSHAMIFPLLEKKNALWGLDDTSSDPNDVSQVPNDVLWDPNTYLSLKPPQLKEVDGQPSREGNLCRDPGISLKDAIKQAGLDEEKYARLVKCIFAQMSAPKGTEPLYIQYDGSKRQLWGTIYCIYAGIPRYMRKTLHIASCPTANDSGKHLIFSQNAGVRARHIIPQTGENTVLDPRMERKISRLGYIDYPALHLPPDAFPYFFLNLDNIAAVLGNASASDSRALKLAFLFWKGPGESKFTEEELKSNFSDALRLPSSGQKGGEWVLERMLTEINRRKLRLTAENETQLDAWLSNTKSESFRSAVRTYKGTR